MEPSYRDGDVIIVSPKASIRRGDRVVLRLKSGDLLAKQLQRAGARRLELAPFNANHPKLSIAVNDRPVEHEIRKRGRGMAVVFRAPLDRSDYSIVTVHTPHMFCPDELSGNGDRRRVGIAVGDIIIEPLDRRRHFAGALWRRLLTRRSRLARVGG